MTEGPVGGGTFVLIGHPVGHSLSPVIHAAAYVTLGVQGCRYVSVDCPDTAAVERQIDALRRGDIAGANITVPWKRLALDLADEAHASASDVGAANVLGVVDAGAGRKIVAYNTDVGALADELIRCRPGARAAVVIGNGGAALASVAACRAAKVDRIAATARRFRGERSASWERADALEALGAVPVEWPTDPGADSALHRALSSSDLIVQSTSDGMRGATDGTAVRDIVPWGTLPPGTCAYDLVYNPAVTPFVAAARRCGLRAESGLGMLVGQAARAIELWLGRRPPPEPLRVAAEAALAQKFPA
jgi:shikimate dehydrogenase